MGWFIVSWVHLAAYLLIEVLLRGSLTLLMPTHCRWIMGICLLTGAILLGIGLGPALQARCEVCCALNSGLEGYALHEAIEEVGEKGRVALPALLGALRQERDLSVQTELIGAIHESLEIWAEGLEPQFFDHRLSDSSPQVRLVAAEVLAANLSEKTPQWDRSMLVLESLVGPAQPKFVRLRAAATLVSLHNNKKAVEALVSHLDDQEHIGGDQTVRDVVVATLRHPAGLKGSAPVATVEEIDAIRRWSETF